MMQEFLCWIELTRNMSPFSGHRLIDDLGDTMSNKCIISALCGVNPLEDGLRINPKSLRNILDIHFETDKDDETGS